MFLIWITDYFQLGFLYKSFLRITTAVKYIGIKMLRLKEIILSREFFFNSQRHSLTLLLSKNTEDFEGKYYL